MNDIMRDCEVIKTKRKTLSLEIKGDGRLVVHSPMRTSKEQIEAFVSSHIKWIEKHMQRIKRENERKRAFSFSEGESVYFLGDELKIRADSFCGRVQVIGGELLISDSIKPEGRQKAVEHFLADQAKILLPKRIAAFSERLEVEPQAVTVTSAKTRWGSCSGKNRISFSLRLMMLPPEHIDYVVVHELAHILEHNHSDRFYARIAGVLPDYRQRQADLKEFARRLTF